jgi:tRNA dimethylallyltransferase
MFSDALILTGPTGCGKTGLALELVDRIGAEIVAMDSMTLYRGMDIGTAKATPEQRDRVRHYLIDVFDPWESANVAGWLARAADACREIRSHGKRPLFVGGTPFYLKALRHGLFPAPPADDALRRTLEAETDSLGPPALHARLVAVDPRTAARLHPNDVRRVVRALEVFALTGRPISEFQQTWDTPAFAGNAVSQRPEEPIPCVVLELPRDELYGRINRRVEAMLEAGWLDEVQRLRALPRPLSREAAQALGYQQLFAHLAGTGPGWAETVEQIKTRTRQFAKRQLTWFRHLAGVRSVPAGQAETIDRVLAEWQP